VLRHALRTIEIQEATGSVHVIQADAYAHRPAGSPPPPSPNDNYVILVRAWRRSASCYCTGAWCR
jgi:hypothetical protein